MGRIVMKTIEERAKEHADRHKAQEIAFFGENKRYSYTRVYNAEITAYERGAKDERRILTNKVWKYLSEKLKPAVLGTDGLVVLEGGINEEEFRKLMIEE